MANQNAFTINFKNLSQNDVPKVGGKNASLGEMIAHLTKKGIKVPGGFAVTVEAYWNFLDENNIREELTNALEQLDLENFSNLTKIGKKCRSLILNGHFSEELNNAIRDAYREMSEEYGESVAVAVRSSATAEDLPTASFAGQQETYLNVAGDEELLEACKKCMASLFTDRAIKYRFDQGFEHMQVGISVGVQKMVRADLSCSGVAFTIEPETGFRDVLIIDGTWGLGENIVQGTVDPDEFIVFKPSLRKNKKSVISRKIGAKQKMMIYTEEGQKEKTINVDTPIEKQIKFVLNEKEIEQLSKWLIDIEEHYNLPMDVEWAKDGITNELFIVQARPETVHSTKSDAHIQYTYELKEEGKVLASGIGLGSKIASGTARILQDPSDADKLQKDEVLVTDMTNPDWDPIMKKAAAIITNKGGRTSHAAIVARELGVVAVVGTGNATEMIKDGQEVTISTASGKTGLIYDGILQWDRQTIDTSEIRTPDTDVMFILADPDRAFQYSFLPNNGVGLMRMEFVISNTIQVHPMALVKFDEIKDEDAKKLIADMTAPYESKEDYFTDHLSQAIATVAAAFYPKDVIVRMSDFKSNEYANLIGGKQFEPDEENPMLGFRGASRYYSELYKEGFRLECEAMRIVRDEMGLTNVKLMIPFCRTVEEGRKVIGIMEDFGLKRGENDLEIYTMIEIPSNVILAAEFAEIFDGFSIGSNDLTQLTLGLDRDSELVSPLFDENNEAVKKLIEQVIDAANKAGIRIGLCGQAPSDFPEYAQFLVQKGIDSISFTADALIQGIENINLAEKKTKEKQLTTVND